MVILPLPLAQCQEIVENLGLNYPLYSDPEWRVFEAYGTGHILYAPKQSWVGVGPDGTVRYVWRQGADQAIQPVPLPLEALHAFQAARAE